MQSETEMEVTFVVHSDEPQRVVAKLEGLPNFAGWALRRMPTVLLHDLYFDLAGSTLGQRGYGLRLRHLENRWILCLKGRSKRRGLVVERVEIEGQPADPMLLARLANELGSAWPAALGPTETAARALEADAAGALAAAGFLLIQDRRTERRQRRVAAAERADTARPDGTALIAIDTVTYVAAATPMRHHEVEIEAVPGTGAATLVRLADALQAAFPDDLQPWQPSKLRTGMALERLATRLGPAALVGPTGDLLPRAYALIRAELDSRSP